MFRLVLKSSRTGPERAGAWEEEEEVMGEQSVIQDGRRAYRGSLKTVLNVCYHLRTVLCCEERLGSFKTSLGVHNSKHTFGQE